MTAQRKQPATPMTVEEFFAWDGGGHPGKLELVEGQVRAMAPASATHGFIQTNIAGMIRAHLRGTKSRCRAGTEVPVVPPMHNKRNARAPDISVTCAPVSDSKVLEAPVLIVEIMSPGNEAETWESIRALADLASLREILVVQSTRVEAEVYTRDSSGAWPDEPVTTGAGGTVRLTCLDLGLAIAEVYEGTLLAGQSVRNQGDAE